jgi:urocanate hydratase
MRNGGPAPEVAEKPHELVVYGGIGRAGLCDGHHKMADYARGDRAKG